MTDKHLTTILAGSAIKHIVAALVGSALTLIAVVAKYFAKPVYAAVSQNVSNDVLLQTLCAAAVVLILLLLWIRMLYRERSTPFTQKFPFDEHGGFYRDPKTRVAVCPACLSDGKIVHMMDVGGPKMCNACGKACRRGKES
jgi:hypothetical protein